MNRTTLLLCGVALTSLLARADRTEETNQAVIFNGNWTTINDPGSSGGSYKVSNSVGDTVTFSFTGDSLALYRYLDPNGGQATVTVDGAPWGGFSFNFSQQRSQIPAVLDHLGAGKHTIIITVAAPNGGGAAGNVTVDAFEFPITFTPTATQLDGIKLINQIRAQAGVPAADLSAALNLAAQAHANYNTANDPNAQSPNWPHTEDVTLPGATGAGPGDRAFYFGYDQGGAESALGGCGSTSQPNTAWLASVYHRMPYISYSDLDVGCGDSPGNGIADFGTRRGTAPANTVVTVWPPDQATGIPTTFWGGGENPPGVDITQAGYPIGLAIALPANPAMGTSTTAFSASLTDQNNSPIPFTPLNSITDPANISGSNDYFIVPNAALTPATTYNVSMAGTDGSGNAFNKSWSFKTFPSATLLNVYVSPTPDMTGVYAQWSTAGPVTQTQIVYGPTPAYGMSAAGQNAGTNTYTVTFKVPPGNYHYQIQATDAAGVTSTSPDGTFTGPPNTIITLVGFTWTSTSATFTWSTAGPVDSTQLNYGTAPTYGQTAAGVPDPTTPNQWSATINGLTPGTLYNYQMSATAGGQTQATANATFTTGN
jgi:hypothetical protein